MDRAGLPDPRPARGAVRYLVDADDNSALAQDFRSFIEGLTSAHGFDELGGKVRRTELANEAILRRSALCHEPIPGSEPIPTQH